MSLDQLTQVSEDGTENGMVAALALAASTPDVLDTAKVYHRIVAEGTIAEIFDLEGYLDAPRRKRGTVVLHDQESFTKVVNEHKVNPATHIYADDTEMRIVAVLNDAHGAELGEGWGDHRADFTLRKTPEWLHWENLDGHLVEQSAFAEHIEDGLNEIIEPSAARMLEIAQTFQSATAVTFNQATTLESGERQFTYEETIHATAGRKGDITIPKELELGIAPFEVTQPYKVIARFRFRITGGKLMIGYKLDRPHDVLSAAFDDTVKWIGDDTEIAVLLGKPPVGVGN